MRKWGWRVGLALVLLAISAYWVLSGFSFSGTYAYDLSGSNPLSESTKQSWRYRMGQVILPFVYDHDTRYALGYKEEVFRSVPIGASQDHVRSLLGEPLSRSQAQDGHSMWHYSAHGSKSENFLLRIIEFGEDGRLLRRHAEFYVD